MFSILKELYNNKKLVFDLSRNDFKSRFAGSYFGIIWAYIQPMVTVLVYWFVFEKALSAGSRVSKSGINVPYLLWLISGLVPWFYFSEVISTAASVLQGYEYLVKKVVFNVSCLPAVKVISSAFVHAFFVGFMIFVFALYGWIPTMYTVQVFYYSFAMMFLCLAISYFTSAIYVFFRDLGQVIAIIMQVLMWMTPIMWDLDGLNVARPIVILLKLNPMYYIVEGYRDSMINHVWFWEHQSQTLYFWILSIVIFVLGARVFKKLSPHFADVL